MNPVGDSKFKWLRRWQHCPVILKMCKINICKHKIIHGKKQRIYQEEFREIQFSLNFKRKNFKSSIQNSENWSNIMIQINLHRHFLTLDEEQHSTMRNSQRMLFVYTSSVSFQNFIYWVLNYLTIFVSYTSYFIMLIPGCNISGKN